jgi:hypothetical protein
MITFQALKSQALKACAAWIGPTSNSLTPLNSSSPLIKQFNFFVPLYFYIKLANLRVRLGLELISVILKFLAEVRENIGKNPQKMLVPLPV